MYYCVFQIGFLQCVLIDETLSGCVRKLNSTYYSFEETITQIGFFGTEEDLEQLPALESLWQKASEGEVREEDLRGFEVELSNASIRCLEVSQDTSIEKLKDRYPDIYVG